MHLQGRKNTSQCMTWKGLIPGSELGLQHTKESNRKGREGHEDELAHDLLPEASQPTFAT